MEKFGIAPKGLALAVDLLVHLSIVAKAEIMEWFLITSSIYEDFNAQMTVQVGA